MSRNEARIRLSGWGAVTPFRRTDDDELGWQVLGKAVQGFVYVDKDARVDAIEFARPQSDDVDIRFRGVSIFGEAALIVLVKLRDQGIQVDTSDPYFPVAPGLHLGFSRDSGEEDVSLEDGLPLHFETVLVAAPGYGG